MRSFGLIVVLVATGLLMAACGGSAKKDAQAPTSSTPTSTPNASQGPKDTGQGTAKAGAVAEAGTGTSLRARGLAQALNSLKSSLVQKGTLNKEASSSASFGGIEGTAAGAEANLRRGPSPAQSLAQLGTMLRSELAGTSKIPAHSALPAVQGGTLQLTSAAQLRSGIPQASAFRAMASFAADSSKLRTKVASGVQTLNAKVGNAVVGTAGALSKQSLTPAKALGSLGGLAGTNAGKGVSSLCTTARPCKQAQGQASVEGNAGAVQEGTAGANFRAAPSAAQTLAGLAPKVGAANKQAAGTASIDSGGGVATGEPTKTTSADAALQQLPR